MANENKVIVEIEVDSKDAQKAIESFSSGSIKSMKDAEKANKGFADSFKTFGAPVAAATAAFELGFAAINKVIATFSRAIDEAVQDQKQFLQIQTALQGSGDASKEATQSIVDFADALEDATGVGDELAKQLFINAKAFGISNEEAKKLTKASIDYAAATGVDVETASRQLGMTLDGTVGRIGNLGAEFRNLTEEQLKNGAAIDLIVKRYDGAAAAQIDTFGGATNGLSNAFGDLLKAIGKIITESTVIISALQGIATAVGAVSKVVSTFANGRDFNEFGKKLQLESARKFVEQSELIGTSTKEVKEQFRDLFNQTEATTSSVRRFATFGEQLANTEIGEKRIGLTGKALEEFNKQAAKAAEDLKKAREEASKFSSSILQGYGSDAEKLAQKTKDTILEITRRERLSFKEGGISHKEAYDLRLRVVEGFNTDVAKINDEARERELQKNKKALDEQVAAAQKARDKTASAGSDPVAALFKGGNTGNDFAAIGVGISSNILEGAQGAMKLVSQTIGGIADIFLPGIGGAVAGLAAQLARGPEATKIMVREFVKAIPDIVDAIAESIPVFVETFVDVMVNRGGAIRIGVAIAKAMAGVQIWENIGGKISDGFKQLDFTGARDAITQGFAQFNENITNLANNIGQAFRDAFVNIFQPLTDAMKPLTDGIQGLLSPINGLIDAIKNPGGGISKSIGDIGENPAVRAGIAIATGGISEIPGFSKGGVVYAADGFVSRGTDTVPAMLTPGEAVVPKDTTVQLAKFLSKQNTPTGSNDAMLMQILQMVSQPMVVKAEAKVNQSAFADIILQLNRQNARLSA